MVSSSLVVDELDEPGLVLLLSLGVADVLEDVDTGVEVVVDVGWSLIALATRARILS